MRVLFLSKKIVHFSEHSERYEHYEVKFEHYEHLVFFK
jgi:hypothetical protein